MSIHAGQVGRRVTPSPGFRQALGASMNLMNGRYKRKSGLASKKQTIDHGCGVAVLLAHGPQRCNARWTLAVTLAMTAASSCNRGAPPDQPPSITADSAGVTIVDSYQAAWTETTAWHRSEDPVLGIGEVDGVDPGVLFASIESVTRLSDGRVVVIEGQSSEIRWFDAAGRHLATQGGRGGGPGRFNSASQLVRLPGDTILVEDQPGLEHVYFGPDMAFVREDPVDRARFADLGPWAPCVGASLADRSFIVCRQADQGAPALRPGLSRSYSRLVRVTRSLDSIYELGILGGIEQWRIEVTGQACKQRIPPPVCLRATLHPFYSVGHFAIGGVPPRIAIVLNPEYVIEIWTPDGRLERVVRRHGARREPSDAERAEADGQVAKWAPGDEALLNRFLTEMEMPDSIPAVYGLKVGIEGDIWVLREGTLESQPQALYDVFEASGRFLGEMRFPREFRVEEVGADYVLGVRRDEDDVPFVQVYALDRRSDPS